MEEADRASQKLPIDRDDCAAEPHDAEDNLEEQGLVVGVGRNAEHRREHQAEEEGSPQVPVPDLFTLLFGVDFAQRVDHNAQLLPDALQVTFLTDKAGRVTAKLVCVDREAASAVLTIVSLTGSSSVLKVSPLMPLYWLDALDAGLFSGWKPFDVVAFLFSSWTSKVSSWMFPSRSLLDSTIFA